MIVLWGKENPFDIEEVRDDETSVYRGDSFYIDSYGYVFWYSKGCCGLISTIYRDEIGFNEEDLPYRDSDITDL